MSSLGMATGLAREVVNQIAGASGDVSWDEVTGKPFGSLTPIPDPGTATAADCAAAINAIIAALKA